MRSTVLFMWRVCRQGLVGKIKANSSLLLLPGVDCTLLHLDEYFKRHTQVDRVYAFGIHEAIFEATDNAWTECLEGLKSQMEKKVGQTG